MGRSHITNKLMQVWTLMFAQYSSELISIVNALKLKVPPPEAAHVWEPDFWKCQVLRQYCCKRWESTALANQSCVAGWRIYLISQNNSLYIKNDFSLTWDASYNIDIFISYQCDTFAINKIPKITSIDFFFFCMHGRPCYIHSDT